MRARRRQMRLGLADIRLARRRRAAVRVGAWPMTIAIFVSAPGAISISRGEGGDPASVVALRAVARAGLDEDRRRDVAARRRRRSACGWFPSSASDRLVATKAMPRWKSLCGFSKQQNAVDDLRLETADALIGALFERDVEERRHPQAHRLRAAVARASADACRRENRAATNTHSRSPDRRAACGKSRRPARRRRRSKRPSRWNGAKPGASVSPVSRSRI